MTKPMLLADFQRLPPTVRTSVYDGLSATIDEVAGAAAQSHTFLRYQWFAAALSAYGGHARTIVVEEDGVPVAALPIVATGPAVLRAASVPGSYWPFRSFAVRRRAGARVFDALLDRLARTVNVLRIGPVYDGDASVMPLLAAARMRGWATVDRFVADAFLLDMAVMGEGWPRRSTLRKNRFHEKHLGEHGALDWGFVTGAAWDTAAFDALAEVERRSWVASRTDGSDAKFTEDGHGAFWRMATADPAIAAMLHAAVLRVDGVPAAFSFDLDVGALKYAIANSYDPAFSKHSPGKLLYYRNLVGARARGVSTVDWGAGDSGYKRVIGADKGPAIRDWLLVRPGVPALLARAATKYWRRSGNQPSI